MRRQPPARQADPPTSIRHIGRLHAALRRHAADSMRIVMIGTGYVGLVSGACFADFGHDVICVDTDAGKIAALHAGRNPDLRARPRRPGRGQRAAGPACLHDRASPPVRDADAVFIAVGTPSRRGDGHADLSYVYAAAREIAPLLCPARPSSSRSRRCRSAPATRSSGSCASRGPISRIRGGLQSGIPARRRGDPGLQASGPHRRRHRRRARTRGARRDSIARST